MHIVPAAYPVHVIFIAKQGAQNAFESNAFAELPARSSAPSVAEQGNNAQRTTAVAAHAGVAPPRGFLAPAAATQDDKV